MARACRTALGDAILDAVQYGTNAGHFKLAGIPSVIFGPGSPRQAHTADEHIEIAEFLKAIDAYAAILRAYATG